VIDRSVGQDFMSVALSELKVSNLEALQKDLVVGYDLQAQHFGSATGPLLMIRPRVMGRELIPIDRKPREVPIDLRETMQAKDSFDIALPADYSVDEIPDPVKVDLGFASYESSTELHGHVLHYTRVFRVNAVTLPAEQYPALRKLAGVIAADEQSQAILKKSE
jgi:hypothetical protein